MNNKVFLPLLTFYYAYLVILNGASKLLEQTILTDPNLIAYAVDKAFVVRNGNDTTSETFQCTLQRVNRFHIQMVGRLREIEGG